jgi:carbamoyltransferase
MTRLILGLNTHHGDTAAALVSERDGVLAAIAEERLSRRKHCASFPALAIAEVLRLAGADPGDITDIAVARDPRTNLFAKAAFVARYPRSGLTLAVNRMKVHRAVRSMPEAVADAVGAEAGRMRARSHAVEHHLAHVASAYFWSPFDHAAGLSFDGAGDFATALWARCAGDRLDVVRRILWPHSLGVFYTALCQFLGFDRYGEEYKVMGLAAYGENRFAPLMRDLVRYDARWGVRLNLRYFRHQHGTGSMESIDDGAVHLPRLWGDELARAAGPARVREAPLVDRDRDLAASMQIRFEEVFLEMLDDLVWVSGERRVVLAGGCALNSVANGRMLGEAHVDAAYFQPAASDDGTALGAALYVMHQVLGVPRRQAVENAYWGTSFDDDAVAKALDENGRSYRRLEREALLDTAARALAGGRIIGWFQGREEWGPRALGNRSIFCNPGLPDMKATLNARIKNREPFRPFAPIVREQDLATCFAGSHPVPFMIVVYRVRPEWAARLPAITHQDGTARVQTIRRDQNELVYDLLGRFCELTGLPTLLNTSFNENEPIVHTPAQAIDCFERTKMDGLAIGSFWLEKTDRENADRENADGEKAEGEKADREERREKR